VNLRLAVFAAAIVCCAALSSAGHGAEKVLAPYPTELEPRPVAHYGSFRVACDSLLARVRHVTAATADSFTHVRTKVVFTYRDRWEVQHGAVGALWARVERDTIVPALRIVIVTRTWAAPASQEIVGALRGAGWAEDNWMSADGPDGMRAGLVCREAMAEIRGAWDGGDDGDSTYLATPGERVEITCVPWRRHPDPH